MDSIYSVIDIETGQLLDEVSYKKPQTADYDPPRWSATRLIWSSRTKAR